VIIKADYAGIELRIAARVTNEERMLKAFQEGEDLHKLTASLVLGKPLQEVTKNERQIAKAVNFGLLYGQGPAGLKTFAKSSYGVSLSLEEATEYRTAFFREYPGLADWQRRVKHEQAAETRTLAGRRRLLGGREDNRKRLNTPVQGTGGDALKAALALLWERRNECPEAFPILACHDEIAIEAPEEHAEEAAEWLKRCMIDAMHPLIAPVPVEVEVTVGKTWAG
jgi:DNA polymerase-1